ncbi:MAG: 30S ribosomal protein S16 [Deltaproteobacteria bacterium]|nr:30S ribosomal protein S16 [Deltaproteobacteria bacterium]
MAVRIRLTRKGSKKKPFYRVVAADSEAPRDGRFLDILGYYNPTKEPAEINLDREKVSKWLENGASASDSVRAILKKEGFKVTATTN